MLVSVKWLSDYVEAKEVSVENAREFADRMIMSGSNIETVSKIGTGIENVLVGRIEKIEKHPNADKLVVCDVNIGSGTIKVVTGAPNVKAGDFVPVAVDGAHVPGPLHGQPYVEGGVTIRSGELRGVLSEGMMCGPQELGIPDKVAPYISKDGIWLLEGDFSDRLGEEVSDVLDLEDVVIDFEITPNRPDCLSMLGMAREAAATFGTKMIYPDTECEKTDENAADFISVEVRSDLCKRYTARVIKDVKIAQSPWWMQKRLMAAGMRPINNIVDITNFVMFEYGQPLHAFDITHLSGSRIIVDTAKDGDVFTTLDGTERKLDQTMLMINDAEKPVAVAGVMGGLNSEITETTDTVVIESANFVGSSVRQTSKKLGLRTEASGRYEKGIDPNLCEAAADRVCKLIELLDCGKVLSGSVDVYKQPEKAKTVDARVSRINKVLGTDIPREQMVKYLESLEMKVEGSGDILTVTPPTVRQDLLEEVDYVEEVARMYGYDNIPNTLPALSTMVRNSDSWETRNKIRRDLTGMGADEIETFSFINGKILDACRIPEDSWERDTIKIINPMGEDTSELRTLILPGMLEVLARNYAMSVKSVRCFEIGKTFSKNYTDENGLPDEAYNLSVGMYGEGESFFTLKGMLEALFGSLGVTDVSYVPESEYGIFHPGRCARIVKTTDRGEKVELGIMGEIHPDVAENYEIGARAYAAELFVDRLVEFGRKEIHYTKAPKFPSMTRDIAVVVDESTPVQEIEEVIKESGTELLREIELFDIYRGEQVGEGKKSVAFSLTYRHDDKTLTDEETNAAQDAVVSALKEKLGASIRDN